MTNVFAQKNYEKNIACFDIYYLLQYIYIYSGNHGKKRQIKNVVDFDFYYNTTIAAILNFSMQETGIYYELFPVNDREKIKNNERPDNKQISKTIGENIKRKKHILLQVAHENHE